MNAISLKKILLVGLTAISTVACHSQQIRPTKPTLQVIPQSDGGICLTKENAVKLGTYILELESSSK